MLLIILLEVMTTEVNRPSPESLKRAKAHLVRAILDDKIHVVKELLEVDYPVDLPIIEETRQTLLMLCASIKHSNLEIFKLILSYKPNLNLQDGVGRTALHLACRGGRIEMVRLLIAYEELDVNVRSCGGETPLMCAAMSGNIFVVGECLNNNFNPFLENSLGMTASDYATYFSNVYG